MSKSIGMLLVLGSMFAVGCSSSGSTTGGDSSAKAADTSKAGGGSGDKIGVKECDDYIDAYSKCIDKMPDAAKGPSKKALDDSMKAWKDAAKGPGKDTLASTCKTMADAMKDNPACK